MRWVFISPAMAGCPFARELINHQTLLGLGFKKIRTLQEPFKNSTKSLAQVGGGREEGGHSPFILWKMAELKLKCQQRKNVSYFIQVFSVTPSIILMLFERVLPTSIYFT